MGRARRRSRSFVRAASLGVFAAQFALLDVLTRGRDAVAGPRAALSVVASVAAWALLALVARTRARRVVVGAAAAALVVVQATVFRYYHALMDVQVAASALHAWADVRPILARSAPTLACAALVVTTIEVAALTLAHRPPRARVRRGVVLALAGVAAAAALAGPPLRRATPEVRALHAVSAALDRARARAPDAPAATLPPLHADRAELPSVLVVLTESVRADDYVPSGADATARETAAATPGRVDLAELRAVSSYTAVSLSALLTARSQEGPRDEILRAPNLFDFARAARDAHGRAPTVGYWSAQSRDVFESKDVRSALDRMTTLETLLGHGPDDNEADPRAASGVDRMIVERFEADLGGVAAPLVAMLHLWDTHAPYVVDTSRAPFQPVDHVVAWSRMETLHNAYKDAIYMQDALVARAVRAFVARAGGRPWLVVFTSDHGEAFGEHGAIHHGQNLFDEQVHVPGFVAWGNGALDAAQARALEANRATFATHLDLLPTVLDALGLWDNFAVRPHRDAMRGQSLLRPRDDAALVPATNCTGMFPCPVNTWGLYGGGRKLLASIYDVGFACFAVGGGSERVADARDPACEALARASRRTFPLLPNGAPNR